jgi:23S rRNA (uracil1939-C5)-methyltransferase
MIDTPFKVQIEKIATGGAGIARLEGKTVFVEGCLPDEVVMCRAEREHRSWLQAELLDIIEASGERVQPECGLYGKCGGCNFQHLSYKSQLAAKTTILKDAFTRIGGFDPPQPLVFPSQPWEYRNRMQFHAVRGKEPRWGLKARKGSQLLPVPDCPIADPGIRDVLKGDGKMMQMLMLPEKDRFTVYSRDGLFLSEGGTKKGKTRILDHELSLDASVFFQANGAVLEKLIIHLQEITDCTDHSLPLADLYCGVGTFATFIGTLFPHIDLIEENETALALARKNLAAHNSTDFFALRSEEWAKTTVFREKYSLFIVDPPRQGLETSLASKLAADGPPLLAYVSCDPATLARDSKILLEGGYELTELAYFDFYPQTAHIESLALFTRNAHN